MVERLVSHKQRVGDFHGDVSIVVVVRWSLVDRTLESMIAAAVARGWMTPNWIAMGLRLGVEKEAPMETQKLC
jgi:NADH:ubiquinone oxidoreductase subunit D